MGSTSSRLLKAVIFTIIVWTIIFLGLLIFHYYFPYKEWLSFGQLFVELLLIPIVIFGFIMAYEEFRESMAKPDLALYWKRGGDKYSSELKFKDCSLGVYDDPESPPTASFLVLNSATTVCTWFQIDIDIPIRLIRDGGDIEQLLAMWVGSFSNEHYKYSFPKDVMRVTFMSLGKVGTFNNVPLDIGWVYIETFCDKQEVFKIKFGIITNKTEMRTDSLLLSLIP